MIIIVFFCVLTLILSIPTLNAPITHENGRLSKGIVVCRFTVITIYLLAKFSWKNDHNSLFFHTKKIFLMNTDLLLCLYLLHLFCLFSYKLTIWYVCFHTILNTYSIWLTLIVLNKYKRLKRVFFFLKRESVSKAFFFGGGAYLWNRCHTNRSPVMKFDTFNHSFCLNKPVRRTGMSASIT